MIVVDTDIMIDILREYKPALDWLKSIGEEEIVLPGFVIMELIQGCRNKKEQQKVEKKLSSYGVVWPSLKTCEEALSVFVQYHLRHGIGIIDALIGQMAVSRNLPLYTFNQKHYTAIPNLNLLEPYKRISLRKKS